MLLQRALATLLLALVASGCSILSVDSGTAPPRVEIDGIVDGHVALGISDESHLVHFDIFDGTSPGALLELVIWKLFRVEVGFAGASLTVGPIHVGLGVLAYDPWVPEMIGSDEGDEEEWEEPRQESPTEGRSAPEHDHDLKE